METEKTEIIEENEEAKELASAKFTRIAIDNTGIAGPEISEGHKDRLEDCIIGYLVAADALVDFKTTGCSFLGSQEVRKLLDVNNATASSDEEKNDCLIKLYDNFLKRTKDANEAIPQVAVNDIELFELKHCLKTNYIMNLNQEIADYIDSIGQKDNNIGKLKTALARHLLIASSSLLRGSNSEVFNSVNYGDEEHLKRIYSIIEGMRHEASFKELVYEMTGDDLVEIIDTNKEDDSRGVDLILRVKISMEAATDNKYTFASSKDIKDGQFIEVDLPIDIKSTKNAADKVLANELSYPTPNHWVMWSNIYREDFRLSFDLDHKSEIGYSPSESPIFLNYDEQLAIMRNIDETNIKYKDADGDLFAPPNIATRINNIKKDILNGINTLYYNNIKRSIEISRSKSA